MPTQSRITAVKERLPAVLVQAVPGLRLELEAFAQL
jgi:hypothetical protein